jgi:hypothetical protein
MRMVPDAIALLKAGSANVSVSAGRVPLSDQ